MDYPIPLTEPQAGFGSVETAPPITEKRRLRTREDKLVADGREVPLFGVNLGASGITHSGAVRFLSSMGVNIVRVFVPFREWDASGQPAVPVAAAIELPQAKFDKLAKLQQLCEDSGVYMLLRDLAEGIGPPYYTAEDANRYQLYGSKDATFLGIWHPGVKTLVLKRLQALLAKGNPYTRKPFGASPSLMGIQLTNEAGWFAADPHLSNKRWTVLQNLPTRMLEAMQPATDVGPSRFRRLEPAERLFALAKATAAAHREALDIIQRETGASRPLLVADNAPYAGPIALAAFEPCDVYGWNLYPDYRGIPEMDAPINAYDLRRENYLDKLQVRIGNKPTVITEMGERLASGGMSRLIADTTTRAATYGYAGIIFHSMYNGIYGDKSAEPAWLASRTPRNNFEIGSDPGALCALQACSQIFTNRFIDAAPSTLVLSAPIESWAVKVVARGFQLNQLQEIATEGQQALISRLGSLSLSIVLMQGNTNYTENTNKNFSGNIEQGHVRANGAEIDWGTFPDANNDWLFIRVPLRNRINLIVLVGRSKPEPASQIFENGIAKLGGFKTYSWPDPRTGYGTKEVVRRPDGPMITLHGTLHYIDPDGKDGGIATVGSNTQTLLPNDGIRFAEVLRSAE